MEFRALVFKIDRYLSGGFLHRLLNRRRLEHVSSLLPWGYQVYRPAPSCGELSSTLTSWGSDKAISKKDYQGHRYHEYYGRIFEELRRSCESVRVLEFGVDRGSSLLAWYEYFPTPKVIGVDIALPKESDRLKEFNRKGIDIFLLNMYDREAISKSIQNQMSVESFDLIIDDGPHDYQSTAVCVRAALPRLSKNGFYIVEDLNYRFLNGYLQLAQEVSHDYGRDFELVVFDDPDWVYARGDMNSLLVFH